MKIWLPAKSHLPVIGPLLYKEWVAYLFSWFGAVYDLFIVFFLINKKTRLTAYFFVVIFHVATAIFFPGIGMFPFVMIACTLIFFPGKDKAQLAPPQQVSAHRSWLPYAIMLYALIQVIIPLRFLLYPGKLFWNEEGYRFSWRVMLM